MAETLTRIHGTGHWSKAVHEKGILSQQKSGGLYTAWLQGGLAGTWRLVTKKPWAIDVAYFQPVSRPLYLLNMAVDAHVQHRGVGRACVEHAIAAAREWPAGSLRLDAYDAAAGAGPFYAKCGFREVGRVTYRGTPLVYFEMLLQGAA